MHVLILIPASRAVRGCAKTVGASLKSFNRRRSAKSRESQPARCPNGPASRSDTVVKKTFAAMRSLAWQDSVGAPSVDDAQHVPLKDARRARHMRGARARQAHHPARKGAPCSWARRRTGDDACYQRCASGGSFDTARSEFVPVAGHDERTATMTPAVTRRRLSASTSLTCVRVDVISLRRTVGFLLGPQRGVGGLRHSYDSQLQLPFSSRLKCADAVGVPQDRMPPTIGIVHCRWHPILLQGQSKVQHSGKTASVHYNIPDYFRSADGGP